MEFRELLYTRRSTRAFTYEKVDETFALELVEAGTRAPNACNQQSWHFYPIIDKNVIEGFYPEVYGGQWIKDASAVIVICTEETNLIERFGDRARELFMIQDTAAATQNILLAAADKGYAGCWIGAFNEDKCREYLNIPEKRRPVAIAAIGKAAREIPIRDRKPIGEIYTFVGEHEKAENGKSASESKEKQPFKLCGDDLANAVFMDLNLANAAFDDVNLEGASFNNINMHGVKFSDINMSETSFGGLTLRGAKFGCVDLDGTVFENPSFDGASFKNCLLKDVKIENCKLDGMTIDGINVAEAVEFYKKNK